MTIETTSGERTLSPLEQFVRAYLEATGGAWEEVEPQVYDVLLPPGVEGAGPATAAGAMLRMSFDPEVLPDHPGAQLARFGTPFIDRLLSEALQRGRSARFWVVGLNLMPHDLPTRLRRALPFAAPGDVYEWWHEVPEEAEVVADSLEAFLARFVAELQAGQYVYRPEQLAALIDRRDLYQEQQRS